ncbi:hypothetical protein ZIOFF_041481 [Zingiber officinale]|uniref:Uncharacterized protein n=1 Tax=Zingiber officinale TaxID=94328 RepID=A0A8J5GHI4_ZINOF|nr:hypothetical protein ZIOFF_041481 [Zingiber officinale]
MWRYRNRMKWKSSPERTRLVGCQQGLMSVKCRPPRLKADQVAGLLPSELLSSKLQGLCRASCCQPRPVMNAVSLKQICPTSSYASRLSWVCYFLGYNGKLLLESVLEEDGEKYVGLYLSNDDADSKFSEIKAIYKLFIYDQLHAEHIQKEGDKTFQAKIISIANPMDFVVRCIWLYPNLATFKDSLGVFLRMDNAVSLSSKSIVYVDFSLCLLDLHNANHWKLTVLKAGKKYKIHLEDFFAMIHASLKHLLWSLE